MAISDVAKRKLGTAMASALDAKEITDAVEASTGLVSATPGTAAAGKALVADSGPSVAGVLTFQATTLQAGRSGTAGTVAVFAVTAAKGKTTFTADDNAGNTTTNVKTAAQAGARTYTIPDAGASTQFVMGAGNTGFFGTAPVAQPSGAAQAAAAAQTQQALTDSTRGAVSTTLAAITAGAAYAQADATAMKNAIASLAAQLALVRTDVANVKTLEDALRTALVNVGLIKGAA